MANRYPLILDTTDGNKVKELPAGDNLYLRNNSITDVQNINALGTINAARITVAGQAIEPQDFTDLNDVPSSYTGQGNKFVKVAGDESGLEFGDLGDFGNITVADLVVNGGDIYPIIDNAHQVGRSTKRFAQIHATSFYGNLRGTDGTLVFDATNNRISYSAVYGAPTSLSEFTNDVGYITLGDIEGSITVDATGDLKGSVFGDDSTLLVDALNSKLSTHTLAQVDATDGQALVWSDSNQRWEPGAAIGIDLTAFSILTTIPSGGGGLAYNFTNGVFTFTPADLTSYLTSETDTLDTVTTRGNTTTNNISVGELTATNVVADGLEFTGVGVVTLESGSNLVLNAANGAGNIVASGSRITGVADPLNSQDVATKSYVDAAIITGVADIARNIESENNVSIKVNLTDSTTHTWRFGEDGNLNLAGHLQFPNGAEIRQSSLGELRLRGAAGQAAQLQGINTDGFVDSAVKALYNNSVGSFVTINTNIDASEHIWTFDYNGDLTFPDDTVQSTAYQESLITFEIDATTVSTTGLAGANTIVITPAVGYAGSDAQSLGFTGRNVAGRRTLVINTSTLCTVDFDFGNMIGPLTVTPSTIVEVIYTGNDWFTISSNSI